MKACTRVALVLALSMNAGCLYADSRSDLDVVAPPNAAVEQPRPFGYVIGDLLTQRVLLQLNARAFEPAALPRAERISAWLERRPATIEAAADGQRYMTVQYQIINAPQALIVITVPAWELRPRTGTDALRIAEWPVSLSPLTPRAVFGQGGLADLRPDRPPPMIDTAPMARHIRLWSSAAIITLMLWVGWWLWRSWHASASQPFASALREIRHRGEGAPEAWQALHRAFDRTAGRVTQPATLPILFQQAPHLTPLRPKIEQFFRQSSARFFGTGVPPDALSVRSLCTELRSIEKAHER